MALITCRNCGASISDKAIECPKCNEYFFTKSKPKMRENLKLYFSIFVVVIVLTVVIFA